MKENRNALQQLFAIGSDAASLAMDAIQAARVGREGDVDYGTAVERGRSGVERAAASFSGALDTVNEERRRLGLSPLPRPDGDEAAPDAGSSGDGGE